MNWQDIQDEKEKYAAYLCSREWSEKKEAVKSRARNRCERCRVRPIDAVHHLTYARKYNESLEDLQAICNHCHEFTHGKIDTDPLDVGVALATVDASGNAAVILCPVCDTHHSTMIGLHPCMYRDAPVVAICCECENSHVFEVLLCSRNGMVGLIARNKV